MCPLPWSFSKCRFGETSWPTQRCLSGQCTCIGMTGILLFKIVFVFFYRQRAELEDLHRQLEENSSLAGRALRAELDKTREEQERRHQVRRIGCPPGLLTS